MVVLMFFFFYFSNIITSAACTCVTRSFEDATHSAGFIFLGELVKSEVSKDMEREDLTILKATFSVKQIWKGSDKNTIELYYGGSSCDYYFSEVGKDFLVYANYDFSGWTYSDAEVFEQRNLLTAGACSRTMMKCKIISKRNAQELKLLNKRYPQSFNPTSSMQIFFKMIFGLLCVIALYCSYTLNLKKKI